MDCGKGGQSGMYPVRRQGAGARRGAEEEAERAGESMWLCREWHGERGVIIGAAEWCGEERREPMSSRSQRESVPKDAAGRNADVTGGQKTGRTPGRGIGKAYGRTGIAGSGESDFGVMRIGPAGKTCCVFRAMTA